MAKRQRETKAVSNQGSTALQHTESYDDNLIPPADEMRKLSEVDPSFTPFVQEYILREQQHRKESREAFVDLEYEKLDLARDAQAKSYRIDIVTLFCVTLIIFAAFAISAICILNDKTIAGSIFAGVGVYFLIRSILNYRKNVSSSKK